MKTLTGPEIIETLTKTGSKEWNEAISSRLESLRGYLSQDEWTKGISIHLRAVQGHAMQRVLGENLSHDAVTYLRGFISALQVVASLPVTIENAIVSEDRKVKSGPKGDAGY